MLYVPDSCGKNDFGESEEDGTIPTTRVGQGERTAGFASALLGNGQLLAAQSKFGTLRCG